MGRRIFHLIGLAVALGAAASVGRRAEELPKNGSPPLERILVIAPHCDDEVLAAGEYIFNSLGRGQKIKVVVMTNGDGYRIAEMLAERRILSTPKDFIEFGVQRQKESTEALGILGLKPEDATFLGLPDRGLDDIWRRFLSPSNPYRSPYTKASAVPYSNAYEPGSSYDATTIINQLQRILDDFQPTEIIYPMPHDAHPDHWATHAFVEYILERGNRARMGGRLKERMYLVHRGAKWPWPRGENLNNTLAPPNDLLNIGYQWEAIYADADAIQQKLRAIQAYRTQELTLHKYLHSFARRNELFANPIASTPEWVPGPIEASVVIPPWLRNLPPIIVDPVGDTVSRDLQKSADFSSVSAAENEDSLFLLIRTARNIPITTRYEVDIKIYDDLTL
ncbi:MAG: PIG-L deacetylase family protein, partial [bacterium]